MISYLKGKILIKHEQFIVIEVNDIGYQVFALPDILIMKEGEKVALYTHQYVRESSLELYGFFKEEELKMFEALIGVSGVGPKTALGILGMTSVEQLRAGVASGDVRILTKVSGIGKKTAERLLVELRDTFMAEAKLRGESGTIPSGDVEVIEALEQLGYGVVDARKAIEELPAELEGTESRLKEALRQLGNNK